MGINLIKRLDPVSKGLIALAFTGFVVSLWVLFFGNHLLESKTGQKKKVGSVVIYQNDIRLKRSGQVHWLTVGSKIDCLEGDMIFTGNDSEATIQMVGGQKIVLSQMSLISLSPSHVTLNSGTIEVDLGKARSFAVESFGERIQLRPGSKVRVEDNESVKRVVALSENAVVVEGDEDLKEYVEEELKINEIPSPLDFTKSEEYRITLADPDGCEEFEFTISRGGEDVLHGKSRSPVVTLGHLGDGAYELRVTGKGDGRGHKASKSFEVRNSPLPAPKLKGKRLSTIFVLLRGIFDFILPSARAENPTHILEWEEEKGATYNIQISKSSPDKVILDKDCKEARFPFEIPSPGLYFWRVRLKKKGMWSPFSEHASLQVEDRVTRIVTPLMKSPSSGAVVKVDADDPAVTFEWEENAEANLTYFLEFYREGENRPFRQEKVKGGEVELRLADVLKGLQWRVYAESPYGNKSVSTQKYEFSILPVEANVRKKDVVSYRLFGHQVEANFKNDYKDNPRNLRDSVGLLGRKIGLNAEYLPSRFLKKNGLVFDLSMTKLDDQGANKYDLTKGSLELGWTLGEEATSPHHLYFGYQWNQVTFVVNGFHANYSVGLLSARYVLKRALSERTSADLGFGIFPALSLEDLQPVSFELNPVLNYRLSAQWLMGLSVSYGKFASSVNFTDTAQKTKQKTELDQLGLGLVLTWAPSQDAIPEVKR